MPFKTPGSNRQGPTVPVISRASPTLPAVHLVPPSAVRYYSAGTQNDVAGGPFGGFDPVPCEGVYSDTYVDLYSCT